MRIGSAKDQYAGRTAQLSSGLRWASIVAGILALWLSYGHMGAPYITNDGYQYLDAASNLASGQCFCTRVGLFDEQVAFGRMPIPFTHFAPGYPLLTAALSRADMTPERAAYLLSAFGYLLVLWLIWDVGLNLGAKPWMLALVSILWVVDAEALYYAAMVGTESLFTAAMILLAALIARDVKAGSSRHWITVGIGLVAGLSYWIRYPGLFLVAAAGVYLLWIVLRIPRARLAAIAALALSAILVAAIQIRNAVLTGSWRGGFTSAGGRNSVRAVAAGTIRSLLHLLTGDRAPLRKDVWIVLLALSFAAVVFFAVRHARARAFESDAAWKGFWWTIFIAAAYTGGIVAAALITIAFDPSRYYFPVYPLLLACAAVLCSTFATGLRSIAVVALVLSAGVLQWRSIVAPTPTPDWILTRTLLTEPVPTGGTLLQWLRDRVGPNQTVLAVEGQALHYILQRPVVAVIPATFTVRRPDAQAFHQLMLTSGSKYLLVLPGAAPESVPEQTSYAFLRALSSGDAPAWLRPAAATRDAAVYECLDCTAPAAR